MAAVALAIVFPPATAAAQTTVPSPAAKPTARKPPAAPAPARTGFVRVSVRDETGAGLSGARILLSGAATGEFTTGGAGTAVVPNLKDGVYRVRCEHEGFITLEREFTVRGGALNPIDMMLSAAPPPPPPPPPVPAPEAPSPAAIPPSGPPVTVSIVDFLDRNFIGRESAQGIDPGVQAAGDGPPAANARSGRAACARTG